MPPSPSLPGPSFVWMLAFSALALWNIRLVCAVPSTVIVDYQDTRIQYKPAQEWSVSSLFNVFSAPDLHFIRYSKSNGSNTWVNGASAIFRFTGNPVAQICIRGKGSDTWAYYTGIGINITGPTDPKQALRMVLLNNASVGTYPHDTPEPGPSTSFFSRSLDHGDYIVEVRHVDTRGGRILTIDKFVSVVSLQRN